MTLTFEWDEGKSKRNVKKHGLTFDEAKTVFNDPFSITISDPDHSGAEEQYLDIGISSSGKLLVVWYTERAENVRIIGCRRAASSERRIYEEREERS